MVAYFRVKQNANGPARLLTVKNVNSSAHAEEILQALRARHVDNASLVGVEEYGLIYTATELFAETNLLGKTRRYSTGERTVTIPENEAR